MTEMQNDNWIVVEDPAGEWWEGSLIDRDRANQLKTHNVVVLPVIPDLFRRAGVGGFHKRAWGAGWSLDRAQPGMVSPMTLYCSSNYTALHWAAKLVPDKGFLEKIEKEESAGQLVGYLRFVCDSSQSLAFKCGILQPEKDVVHARELTRNKLIDGAFYVGGSVKATVPGDGIYGFALYGHAPGLRVAWSAATQAIA